MFSLFQTFNFTLTDSFQYLNNRQIKSMKIFLFDMVELVKKTITTK
jgi:hypothetical protein